MRKICIFLCVVLLLVTSLGPATATDEKLKTDITLIREARQLYVQCLASSGRSSFSGFCGLMTSHQLWKLGINEKLEIYDGNKQFEAYKNVEKTSGGYVPHVYAAPQYDLRAALNEITNYGKKDVRNLLICFQWTSTVAGAKYGHACLINAVENGVVYFTESFDYALGRLEGQTIACSIDMFADYFADWTLFEGVIHFTEGQYADSCVYSPINTYLQLRFDSNLRSQPCLMGENNCVRVRALAAGELLHATGVFEDEYGDLYYRVEEGNAVAYVSANAVFRVQKQTAGEGWFVKDGIWYCYENGAPRTGWVTRIGVKYYLQADGSVTTGWAEMDGQTRYFSTTGALCRGWFMIDDQMYYQNADGVLAKGLQAIDGKMRYFGKTGALLQDGRITINGMTYSIIDGVAVRTA